MQAVAFHLGSHLEEGTAQDIEVLVAVGDGGVARVGVQEVGTSTHGKLELVGGAVHAGESDQPGNLALDEVWGSLGLVVSAASDNDSLVEAGEGGVGQVVQVGVVQEESGAHWDVEHCKLTLIKRDQALAEAIQLV